MNLEVYTLGLALTPLTILEKAILVDISWNYLFIFNLIIWVLIGLVYLVEAVFK